MMDEQRPWRDADEYRDFLYAAGEPSPLTFWTEERDAALAKLLARVWREAHKAGFDAEFQNELHLIDNVKAERLRADAAEAQRDRLAAALSRIEHVLRGEG